MQNITIITTCGSEKTLGILFCLNINLQNFCTVVLLLVIGIQVKRRLDRGQKWTSKKCLIFYLVVIDLIMQFIGTSITQNIYLYETETNFRNLIFVALFYYFMHKVSGLTERRNQIMRRVHIMTMIILTVIIGGYVLVLIKLDEEIQYDKISKITGTICAFGLTFYGYKLQRKLDSKTYDYFYDEQAFLRIKEFSNAENQKEDLWVLLLVYVTSQFLSVALEVYFLVKSQNPNVDQSKCLKCQTIPCVLDLSPEVIAALELTLRFVIKMIVVYFPILAIIRLFWSTAPRKYRKEDLKTSFLVDEAQQSYFVKSYPEPLKGSYMSDATERRSHLHEYNLQLPRSSQKID